MRTGYNGAVEGTYKSLPWGDGQSTSGTDTDAAHYAMLDYDSETNTDHAQFRQHNLTQGRFMSPDPYDGSYDLTNPQSLNRYTYALDSPLSAIDPMGLMECQNMNCGGGIGGGGDCSFDEPFCDSGCDPLRPGCGGIGGGWGDDGWSSPISAPQPEFKGYKDLDPTRIMNDHLGLPASMRLRTGGILDIFGVGFGGECHFGVCGGVNTFDQGKTGVGFDPTSRYDLAMFAAGLYQIYKTFKEMEAANVKGDDKFFHCTAMARASVFGPGGEAAAVTASWGREATDTLKYRWYLITRNPHGLNFRDSIADSREDLKADYAGINGGTKGCAQYWVRGLP